MKGVKLQTGFSQIPLTAGTYLLLPQTRFLFPSLKKVSQIELPNSQDIFQK